MVKGKNQVESILLKYYNEIKEKFPVKKIILYGSYAKSKANDFSDIDVGVVIDLPDHLKRIEITASLFHYAGKIDNKLEPKCIFWDEYQNHTKASILSEIISTGIEIV